MQVILAKESEETIGLSVWGPSVKLLSGVTSGTEVRKGETQLVIPAPEPGVWEFLCDNRALLRPTLNNSYEEPRPKPLTPTALTLKVKLLRTEPIRTAQPVMAPARDAHLVTLRNTGAPIAGTILWSALGSERTETHVLRPGLPQIFDVTVPTGARLLKIQLDGIAGTDADVTLMLFQTAQGRFVMRGGVRGPDAALVDMVENPAPGAWKVVVDPFTLPQSGVSFTYREIIASDAFGSLAPASLDFRLKAGETVNLQATAKILAPRRLVGVLRLAAKGDAQSSTTKPFTEIVIPLDSK